MGEGSEQGPHCLQLRSFLEIKRMGNCKLSACVRMRELPTLRNDTSAPRNRSGFQAHMLGSSQHPRCNLAQRFSKCLHKAASASPGNLLEMQVLRPHLLNQKLKDRASESILMSHPCDSAAHSTLTICADGETGAEGLCCLRKVTAGKMASQVSNPGLSRSTNRAFSFFLFFFWLGGGALGEV